MIRHLSDEFAPAWHCRTCEVGWSSPLIGPLCWLCRRRGERGDVRRLVAWFGEGGNRG